MEHGQVTEEDGRVCWGSKLPESDRRFGKGGVASVAI